MNGREDKKSNDLFFVCSLIAYIARKTKNRPAKVVDALGKSELARIYELADIYHSDNIDAVCDSFVSERNILNGDFDNVADCEFSVPTHWDIGKVYKRLILMIQEQQGGDIIGILSDVYHSPVSDLIEDYNSSFYYDSPQCIFAAYQNNGIPE